MNIWSEYCVLSVIGLILFPRIVLVYFGLIPPLSSVHAIGILIAPRVLLAINFTSLYWDSNPLLVIVCWIIALTLDIVGRVFQAKRIKENRVSIRRFIANRRREIVID